MCSNSFELELIKKGFDFVIGVDEVGRGAWAGPVVVGCFIYRTEDELIEGVRDSKQISKKKREKLYKDLLKNKYSIGQVDPEKIDEINISNAVTLAIQKALQLLEDLPGKGVVLLDGNINGDFGLESISITGGDAKHYSIAAASILAKVYRDDLMAKYVGEYPQYGFERHVGYGTRQHQVALDEYGVTDIHRKSYSPISKRLPN